MTIPTRVLGNVPGSIAGLSICAKVLQLRAPRVTTAHAVRVPILVTATAPLFRLAKRLSAA